MFVNDCSYKKATSGKTEKIQVINCCHSRNSFAFYWVKIVQFVQSCSKNNSDHLGKLHTNFLINWLYSLKLHLHFSTGCPRKNARLCSKAYNSSLEAANGQVGAVFKSSGYQLLLLILAQEVQDNV